MPLPSRCPRRIESAVISLGEETIVRQCENVSGACHPPARESVQK
jgi:hypothetical protein